MISLSKQGHQVLSKEMSIDLLTASGVVGIIQGGRGRITAQKSGAKIQSRR
jgi:hypothetical protein